MTGSTIMIIGFAGLWASRSVHNIAGYALSLFMSTCGLNIAFAGRYKAACSGHILLTLAQNATWV